MVCGCYVLVEVVMGGGWCLWWVVVATDPFDSPWLSMHAFQFEPLLYSGV